MVRRYIDSRRSSITNSRTSLPTDTFEPYRIDSECAVPYLGIRSIDGAVQEDRLVRLAYLGRESNVQKPKDIGNAGGRKPQHPVGGEPGRRASRRRFLHNTTCNSISTNYELADNGLEALEPLIVRLVRG